VPSKSDKQARLMRAVAHGWKKPGGGGPSLKVAEEFMQADMAKKIKKRKKRPWTKAKINKQDTRHGKMDMPFKDLTRYAGKAEGGEVAGKKMEMRHAKALRKIADEEMKEGYAKGGGVERKGKTRGHCVKMARGGGVEIRGKTRGKFI